MKKSKFLSLALSAALGMGCASANLFSVLPVLAEDTPSGDTTDTGTGGTNPGTGGADTGTDTGAGDTGSGDTNTGDTGTDDTGTGDTGTGGSGAGDTGTGGSGDTGTGDTGTPSGPTQSSGIATDPNGNAKIGDGTGTITIKGNEGQTLVGKQFMVYKIFDEVNGASGESVSYQFNPTYKAAVQKVVAAGKNLPADQASSLTIGQVIDYMQSLREDTKPAPSGSTGEQEVQGPYSKFRIFVENLYSEIKAEKLTGTLVDVSATTAQNSVVLTGVTNGYFMIAEQAANLPVGQAASMLIVSTANPSAEMNIKSDVPRIEKKVQEDSDLSWGDVADFEIGQTVPYKYTSNVPNMNGYKSYMWAAQDKMNKALTFNPDTVKVEIAGKDNTGADKTYVLTASEIQVTSTATADWDYEIKIPNLKEIVDREFPNFNASQENTYGQSITVTYNCTLNDNAADYIGQPLENDVRLEFSSNPQEGAEGETNTTPWDRVVVFTFELDNLKVNKEDAPLEGAKFKLYEDADCTKEILVKANPNGDGYVVMNADSASAADAVEMVSNGSGEFKIYGLDQGTYYLKETAAPEGYYLLEQPIEITVAATYTEADPPALKTLTGTSKYTNDDGQSATTDLETSVDTGIINNKIVNNPGGKLPITGSALTIILLVGGGAAIGAGLYADNKKKAKK